MSFTFPKSNLDWLRDRTIFLTRHGSHAYGTNTPTSDEDFKGLAIPPPKYFTGYLNVFEQAEFKHQVDGQDVVIYNITKFFKLAADCNPSIIEVLFTDPGDHVIRTPLSDALLERRNLFISKKAKHTFSGYATSQLKRMGSHYRWLTNPPAVPPTRWEFGLPERTVIPQDQLAAARDLIRKKVQAWDVPVDELDEAAKIAVRERFTEALAEIDIVHRTRAVNELKRCLAVKSRLPFMPAEYIDGYRNALDDVTRIETLNLEHAAGQALGMDSNFLELLDKERLFRGRQEEWRQYQQWLVNRNPARSEQERRYGYDTKHGMHLVRLLRMGEEILTGQGVIVKRPDAEELLAIRDGAWEYERLIEYAEAKNKRLDDLYTTSTAVPETPDRDALDELCQRLVGLSGGSSMGHGC